MKLVGYLLIFIGVAFGLWAGLWWAFIGGIVDVVKAIRAPELQAIDLACGIAKVLFAGLIGWGSAAVALIPGAAIVRSR